MAGQLVFTPQQFQEAATKYRRELLMLPIIGCYETLQYMTGRPGIRYKENVGAISGDAQFAPYKPSRSTDFNLNVDYRTLETYFGSVVAKFEPNSAVSTILGATGATKGDGQMQAPTALHVLALIAKGLSGAACARPDRQGPVLASERCPLERRAQRQRRHDRRPVRRLRHHHVE